MIEQVFKTLQYGIGCFIIIEAMLIFLFADIYLISVLIESVKDWLWFKKWNRKG